MSGKELSEASRHVHTEHVSEEPGAACLVLDAVKYD